MLLAALVVMFAKAEAPGVSPSEPPATPVTYPLTKHGDDPWHAVIPPVSPEAIPAGIPELKWGASLDEARRKFPACAPTESGVEVLDCLVPRRDAAPTYRLRFRSGLFVWASAVLPPAPGTPGPYEMFWLEERWLRTRYGPPTQGVDETWASAPPYGGFNQDREITKGNLQVTSAWEVGAVSIVHDLHGMRFEPSPSWIHRMAADEQKTASESEAFRDAESAKARAEDESTWALSCVPTKASRDYGQARWCADHAGAHADAGRPSIEFWKEALKAASSQSQICDAAQAIRKNSPHPDHDLQGVSKQSLESCAAP